MSEGGRVEKDHVAKSSIAVDAPADKVWSALVTPDAIKQYMFGTTVTSDWQVGRPIVWKGEWQGKQYEDKGTILRNDPPRTLQYSHFSPQSGVPDRPENYHTVTIHLEPHGTQTRVVLTQDNNPTEQVREHYEKNWTLMLSALKQFVEQQARR
jgi:uncharacterized protein YndB with AHSA1/START domain